MSGKARVLVCACRSVRTHRTAVAGRRIAVIVAAAGVISGTTALPALAGASVAPSARPHQQENSSPPDRTIFRGTASRAHVRANNASGIFVIDATAAAASTGGNEPSIAVNPANPNQIAITRFTFA